jgi:PAS domain S-box-containing protein
VRGFECQFRKRDGTEIWVSLNTRRVAGPDGRTLYYEGFIEDITERRRAEKGLREAEELYRGIFEGAAEGIFRTAPSGRPLTANPTMARMLGYDSPAQLMAEIADTGSLIWPNASDRAHLVEALETRGELRNYECQLRRRDGTFIWALMSARRVTGPDGRAVCFEGFISDITEKKRMEEQFLRVQRLESIGMLAAGIAHDLNNVLAPIGMAVPLLRNSRSEPAELRVLRTLESSAERGSSLVRQILGFAHGVSGAPQLVQMKHLLRDITEMIVETFPKSVVLDELIPRDLWPVVANPTQIHQVLLNLCVNARDAMPQGGRLRLTAENVSLDAEQAAAIGGARPGAWVMLHVEDSGTGIAAEVLPRIWEPFFTTKGAGKGTGLGLPTVRGIVETHGGFMTVESELGRGTVFRVYLPAAESAVTAAPGAAASTATKGHGETILFADDERAIREIVEPTLNYGGYKVVLAEDGAQATEIFRAQPDRFALVVTDLDMPVVDGATFARNVRSLRPAMKVLALSGLEKRAGDVKWEDFADEFLQKPFAADELLAAVERLLPAASDATNQP